MYVHSTRVLLIIANLTEVGYSAKSNTRTSFLSKTPYSLHFISDENISVNISVNWPTFGRLTIIL